MGRVRGEVKVVNVGGYVLRVNKGTRVRYSTKVRFDNSGGKGGAGWGRE